MKVKSQAVIARSSYWEKKAKPLSKYEQREERNIKICLNCKKLNCRGWCEKVGGKSL